jgi:hypothetical protein
MKKIHAPQQIIAVTSAAPPKTAKKIARCIEG